MFLKSLSSLLKENLISELDPKYKVCSVSFEKKEIELCCKCITTNKNVKFTVDEIISKGKLKYFSVTDALLISKIFNDNFNYQPLINNTEMNKGNFYCPLMIAFAVCLIISNLAAIKICNFFGLNLPGGILIFPFLYILNDILTEVYGFSASRRVIWTGLLCNLTISLVLYLVVVLPPASFWKGQASFEYVFSLSPRIFFASCISYLIGELLNAVILSSLKLKLKGQFFAFRAIFSTILGSFVESIIFCYMAFWGSITHTEILKMSLILTMVKMSYEILVMPVTVKIVAFLKLSEKKDVFERPDIKKWFSFFKTS